MMLLTAGDRNFSRFIRQSVTLATSLGYDYRVYDLGGLGFGKDARVDHATFSEIGHYLVVDGVWKTKALHKPSIVLDALTAGKFTVYLDADARVVKNIDELEGDYDVGVTVRRPGELETVRIETWRKMMGHINAGVIAFRPGPKTEQFVRQWLKLTDDVKNDQRALNHLVNPTGRPLVAGMDFEIDGVRIRTWSGDVYNHYYFLRYPAHVKILHYKAGLWKSIDEMYR